MIEYRTAGCYEEESEVRRSRFIGVVRHADCEESVFAELNALRKKYSDATHVCYAAIFDRVGNAARFSDDGEPSGTAGQPILEALKNSGYKETLVAVVRYFGGIKLGAGGLVRAYSAAASSALKNAPGFICEPCDFYVLKTDFSKARRFSSAAARLGLTVTKAEYSDRVTFTVYAPAGVPVECGIAELLGEAPDLVKVKTDYIKRPEVGNLDSKSLNSAKEK